MTSLLSDTLEASAPSRVINLIAPAYQLGSLNWEVLEDMEKGKQEYNPGKFFAQSKLALVLFSIKLADVLKGNQENCLVFNNRF